MMEAVICFLFPAVIMEKVWLEKSKAEEEKSLFKMIYIYVCCNICINLICGITVTWGMNAIEPYSLHFAQTSTFFIKYLLMATVLAEVLPRILRWMGKNIHLNIHISKKENNLK